MFTVRPLQKSSKNIFRVYVSATSLILLKLQSGDLCELFDTENNLHHAIIWAASEKIQDSIVQVSRPLQEIYGLKLGDKISIHRPADVGIPTATHVRLQEISASERLSGDDRRHWEWYLRSYVPSEHEVLCQKQKFIVNLGDETRGFVVQDTSPLLRIKRSTEFSIANEEMHANNGNSEMIRIAHEAIGGLRSQIQRLQQIVNEIQACTPTRMVKPTFHRPPQGVLLYGAKGTGKSLLIDAVASASWRSVVRWNPGKSEKEIQKPALIIIEDIESISDLSSGISRITQIRSLFRSISGDKALVIAETRHPNSIDESLRAVARFEEEIELTVPTPYERGEILRAIRATELVPDDTWINYAAERTHGFTGADLHSLLQKATSSALGRWEEKNSHQTAGNPEAVSNGLGEVQQRSSDPSFEALQYTSDDLQYALSVVRPSALKEVVLEIPNVHWSDIGGYSQIKQRLQEAVNWPLKFHERMKALNVSPTKGILLYGPPGCSKTLLVKALATEAELNFLAVKGAELISKYVGDSEKAVRDVFRKARLASPSIIFFDEIDSIARRGNTDLNVLTTLLNEMDGFELLRDVFVVAATNKPQVIDPALMRPGRLDQVLYVSLPDFDARRDILQSWFDKSNVDADPTELANMTEGYSGAEIVAICQTAGRSALRFDRRQISLKDLEEAIDETSKGVTLEMLKEYTEWNASRR